ncbi:hypothetical protein EDD11_009012 [Mortierella claussenii]|nr:hypothetical protein EDD11_009012 [Mortierella claussenii]
MPSALPRGEVAEMSHQHQQQQSHRPRSHRQALDSFLASCPLYSGHLLKQGSNERWQSRLFTFDGAVSSPFAPPLLSSSASPSVFHPHPHSYNPNTKWFVTLASITDIRLVLSKSYSCFPYRDASRSLSIQTADGRTLTLRARKDMELNRWYFVLYKMWSFHRHQQHQQQQQHEQQTQAQELVQQAAKLQAISHLNNGHRMEQQAYRQHPQLVPRKEVCMPLYRLRRDHIPAASLLPAHQQSAHLFNKYLQRLQQEQQEQQQQQQQRHDPQDYQPEQPRGLQQEQQQERYMHILQHQQQHAPYPLIRGHNDYLEDRIPSPKVSAFIPDGLDWGLQYQGDDYEDEEGVQDDEYENEAEDVCDFIKNPAQSGHPSSAQPASWAINGILEPAKAATIEMWCQSLQSPLAKNPSHSALSEKSDSLALSRTTRMRTTAARNYNDDGSNPRLVLTHVTNDSLANEHDHLYSPASFHNASYCPKWFTLKDSYLEPHLNIENALLEENQLEDFQLRPCMAFHHRPQQVAPNRYEDNLPLAVVHSRFMDLGRHDAVVATGLGIHHLPQRLEDKTSETDPLHLQPSSRWQKTQLSSIDDSCTNRDSLVAKTMTPDMSRCSYPTFPNRDSYLSLNRKDRDSIVNSISINAEDSNHGSSHINNGSSDSPIHHGNKSTVKGAHDGCNISDTRLQSSTPSLSLKKTLVFPETLPRPLLEQRTRSSDRKSASSGGTLRRPPPLSSFGATSPRATDTASTNKSFRTGADHRGVVTAMVVEGDTSPQAPSPRLSLALSEPSLSLHGSSYTHLPIHGSDFIFPQQLQTQGQEQPPTPAEDLQINHGPVHSPPDTAQHQSTLQPERKASLTAFTAAGTESPADGTRITTAASLLPPPPARPPRRRPITSRLSFSQLPLQEVGRSREAASVAAIAVATTLTADDSQCAESLLPMPIVPLSESALDDNAITAPRLDDLGLLTYLPEENNEDNRCGRDERVRDTISVVAKGKISEFVDINRITNEEFRLSFSTLSRFDPLATTGTHCQLEDDCTSDLTDEDFCYF